MEYLKNVLQKLNRLSLMGKIGAFVILIILVIGLFGNLLSFYPHNIPGGNALEAPSLKHWLGTDDLGIDIWAQICYGARISVFIGLSTAVLSGIGGSIIGVIAGYFGKKIDKIIMRLTDIIIVLPDLPVMIVLGAFFGPDIKNIIIVLSLFLWTFPARIIRSKILSVKEEKYFLAAKSYGAGLKHLFFRHFIPHISPLIMISMIRIVNRAIIAEASLAFLGLGDPASKSWGMILNRAINFKGIYFTDFWKWWVLSPVIALLLLVISVGFISRDVEKIFNSKAYYRQNFNKNSKLRGKVCFRKGC
ncbi:ABC transporter permease [Herbivorax sp. ANBcel31]|uniref:ABC transporter permease n=1 Tax=Herbivorax sp. ANBcel31 TaxID=3069754 RepID=UPI0027B11EF9|nr:ABC transporter permease [Herbivorax sp. ANBcel31]MDQ2085592.1 ABC transporter permease [Herbivorax sp. ANBcel31]